MRNYGLLLHNGLFFVSDRNFPHSWACYPKYFFAFRNLDKSENLLKTRIENVITNISPIICEYLLVNAFNFNTDKTLVGENNNIVQIMNIIVMSFVLNMSFK